MAAAAYLTEAQLHISSGKNIPGARLIRVFAALARRRVFAPRVAATHRRIRDAVGRNHKR